MENTAGTGSVARHCFVGRHYCVFCGEVDTVVGGFAMVTGTAVVIMFFGFAIAIVSISEMLLTGFSTPLGIGAIAASIAAIITVAHLCLSLDRQGWG